MSTEVYTEDVQFKLHDKFEIFLQETDDVRSNITLLAAASAQGLLFAGNPNAAELKVFMIKQLVDAKTTGQKLLVRSVPLPAAPNAIACSADSRMLAINYTQNGSAFLNIYSVPSFLTQNIATLYNIRLSPEENITALQLLWNPVLTSSIAVILSNGAVGVYTLKDQGQFEMHTLDKAQQVKCGCWSPKGKQIVFGFPNGKLQQFKPDLTPAKTIACPPGTHPGPFNVIALHWLSTFQFAAIFLQEGEEMLPHLYIINAPKGGTPSYVHYIDNCYSSTDLREQQFSFTHIPQWNLLLISSANGIEVGILATKESGDTPTWFPYSLAGEARIEMPLVQNTTETYPIGFAFDNSSSHQLTVGEQKYPVMPMVHVLSTHGHLISYDFLNLIPGAVDVCSPPPPIQDASGQFKPLGELKPSPAAQECATPANSDVSFAFNTNAVTSTPAPQKDKPAPMFAGFGGQNNQPNFTQPSTASFGFGGDKQVGTSAFAQTTTGVTPKQPLFGGTNANATPTIGFGGGASTGFAGFAASSANTFGGFGGGGGAKTADSAQNVPIPASKPAITAQQPQKPQETVKTSGEINKPLYTVPNTYTAPAPIAANTQQQHTISTGNPEMSSSEIDEIVKEMIAVTINSFSAEIRQSAKQSKGLLDNIGDPAEMKGCTKRLNVLQEINEQAKDREFEMDVQNLRHALNESYAILGEVRSKLVLHKNPDLPRLAVMTTHDPVTKRQLAKLNNYVLINQSQLQYLQQQIDDHWSDFQDTLRRSSKLHMHIPCLDGIYERMSNLKDMMAKERNRLEQIKRQLNERGYHYKTMHEAATPAIAKAKQDHSIDNLANSILSLSVTNSNITHRPKLPVEKLNVLRSMVQQQQDIKIIKPQRPNRVGLKSEVILETKLKCDKQAAALQMKHAKEDKAEEAAKLKQGSQMKAEPVKPQAAFNVAKPTQTSLTNFNLAANKWQNPSEAAAPKPAAAAAPNFTFNQPSNGSSFSAFNTQDKGFSFAQSKPSFDALKAADAKSSQAPTVATQAPVSFAAKVITSEADNSNMVKPSASTASRSATGDTKPADEPPKSFTFGGLASMTRTPHVFTGFGSIASNKTGDSMFDGKANANANTNTTSASSTFSFGGLSNTFSSAASTFGAATATTTAAAPTFSFAQPHASSAGDNKTQKPAANAFVGFGQKVESSLPTTTTTATDATVKAATTTTATTSTAAIATTTVTANTAAAVTSATTVTASDAADTLLGNLNICKPTTKETDSSKPANIFAGLATSFGGGTSGGFNFGNAAAAAAPLTFGTVAKPSNTESTTTTPPPDSVFTFKPASSVTTTTTTTAEAKPATAATITTKTNVDAKTTATTTPASVIKTTTAATAANTTASTTTTTTTAAATITSTSTSISAATSAATASTFSFASAFSSLSTGTTAVSSTTTSSTTVTSTMPTFAPVASSAAAPITPFGGITTTATTTANIFGGAQAAQAATTAATGSIFSATSTTTTTPTTNLFGSVAPPAAAATPASGASLFGSTSPPPPTGNIFGGVAKPTGPAATNIFGGTSTPFGSTPATAANTVMFGGTATGTTAAGGSIFGGTAANTGSTFSGFGAAAAGSPAAATGGSIFGGAAQPFGAAAGATPPSTNIFGSPTAASASATGGNIFGQNTFGQANAVGGGGSIFGGTGAASPQQPATAGSIFGGNNAASATSGGSIFGGGTATQGNTSAFGSPTPVATGFGAFSQPSNAPAFGSPNTSGSFAQGGASVAQTGFGSPQQQTAFAKPVFGGAPAFGSPTPAFGATPSFGGAATFGSPKPFSSFGSPTAATSPTTATAFGSPAGNMQKNNLFETLGSTADSGLSFGNLAQTSAVNQQPKAVFGGSKFMNYRA